MENQPQPSPATTSATTSQLSEQPQQPSPQPQSPQTLPSQSTGAPQTMPPTTITTTTPSLSSQPPSASTQSPNQNPNSKPYTPLPHLSAVPPPSQSRPTSTFPRPQPSQQPHFPHFSSPLSSLSPASALASVSSSSPSPGSSSSSSVSSSGPSPLSGQLQQRPGMAIGIPSHQPNASPPFTSSFGQHFGGLGRTGVNATESASSSTTGQVRPPMQGMGMLGSLGSNSQVRTPGIPAPHQQRPVQPSLRPPTSATTQATTSQNLQGHGIMRAPSVGSLASPSPNASQSMQSHTQPWLSPSAPQGKPPLPSSSYRQQLNTQNFQQRSHIPQPHPQQQQPQPHLPPQPDPQQPILTTSNQQQSTSVQQQQPSSVNQALEHIGQVPQSRPPQALPHLPQIARVQGGASQKPSLVTASQANVSQTNSQSRLANTESNESSTRILSKRSIHELVNQVDPSEALDPEVEEILVDIAEDFVESITKFGCLVAKHRKSSTLEAKDILLHLEKNWNMTLPGFADEIKSYRRQPVSDIHKERLSAIKKSIAITDAAHAKNSTGHTAGNAKGSITKMPANIIGSPNMRNG